MCDIGNKETFTPGLLTLDPHTWSTISFVGICVVCIISILIVNRQIIVAVGTRSNKAIIVSVRLINILHETVRRVRPGEIVEFIVEIHFGESVDIFVSVSNNRRRKQRQNRNEGGARP